MPVLRYFYGREIIKTVSGYVGGYRYHEQDNLVVRKKSPIPYSWMGSKIDIPKTERTRAFKIADALYSCFPDKIKLRWRHGVKKPGISGYNLYMLECVAAFVAHMYAPDFPSISGGYSYKKVQAGCFFPPPESTLANYQWLLTQKNKKIILTHYD